jgi:hypothetical protein
LEKSKALLDDIKNSKTSEKPKDSSSSTPQNP